MRQTFKYFQLGVETEIEIIISCPWRAYYTYNTYKMKVTLIHGFRYEKALTQIPMLE